MKFIKNQIITFLIALNLILFTSCALLSIEEKSKTSQFNSKTIGNDWGRGSVFYLDRHSVDCGPNKIIQGFHLYRPNKNQIAYEFSCGGNANLVKPNTYVTQTPWNGTDRNERHSTNYLDRHNVQCRQGFALQQFKLIRNGRNIAYQFKCAQLAKALECRSEQTPTSHGNKVFENIYLDRQRIFAGADRALTNFKLNSKYKGRAVNYSYSYTSCKMGTIAVNQINKNINSVKKAAPKKSLLQKIGDKAKNLFKKFKVAAKKAVTKIPVFNKKTSPGDWGNGSVFNFDKHNVECGNGFLMQGFHLKRPTPNTLAYEYACVKNIGTNNPNDSYTQNTPWNDTGNNQVSSTNYLDRHSLACKPGFALQQFKMVRNNKNKIAFNYRCAKSKLSDCGSEITKESDGNNVFQNIYLDRQQIITSAGRVLTQFKLNSRYAGGKVYYHYSLTTCQMNPMTIKDNKKVTSKINRKITGKNNIKITGKINRKITGKKNIKITGKINRKINGKNNIKITGKINRKISGKNNGRITGKINRKITGKKNIKITGKNNRKITGKINRKITGKNNIKITGKNNGRIVRIKYKTPKNIILGKPNLRKQTPQLLKRVSNFPIKRNEGKKSHISKNPFSNEKRKLIRKSSTKIRNLTGKPNLKKSNNNRKRIPVISNINDGKRFQVKRMKNKSLKFVPPSLITPKKLKENKKNLIKEGNNFCNSFCEPNTESKEKKCWMNGVKPCFSCQLKDKDSGINKDADQLCVNLCNSVGKSETCAFYSYLNQDYKIVNSRLLSKFGLQSFKKYLKKKLF